MTDHTPATAAEYAAKILREYPGLLVVDGVSDEGFVDDDGCFTVLVQTTRGRLSFRNVEKPDPLFMRAMLDGDEIQRGSRADELGRIAANALLRRAAKQQDKQLTLKGVQ